MGKTRRASALAVALTCTLLAASCGSSSKTTSTTSAATTASTTAGGASSAPAGSAAPTTAGAASSAPAGSGGAVKCEAGTPKPAAVPSLKGDGKGKSVGLLFDVTGRGDKSFNDGAAAGLDKSKTDFGIVGVESTPAATDGSDRADRLKQVADGPSSLIIAVGFLWDGGVKTGAKAYPSKNFAIVDDVAMDDNGTPDNAADDKPFPNVRNIVFAAEQGSYLVGVAAACASKSGKIGFIGGVQTDLIKTFEAGYIAGAKSINPKIQIESKYITQPPDFTGFNDPTKGKSTAAAMYSSGIDVIYHAAGGTGKGLFEAAKETGAPGKAWAIGVDSDQYQTVDASLQPYILTSMLKRVDVAAYEAIADQLNGAFKGEIKSYDLKSGGIGYSGSNKAIDAYAGTIEKAKTDIISGKVTVPTKP